MDLPTGLDMDLPMEEGTEAVMVPIVVMEGDMEEDMECIIEEWGDLMEREIRGF